MEFPAYWLRRPELLTDPQTLAAFDRLLDQALAHGPERPIDYRLDAPKWQFLCHAAERAKLVLHGSGDPGIKQFEPRQPADSLEFSNRRAVFAATDGIWPIYYAVLDRERYPMMLCNACVRACPATGERSDPHYFFSISSTALTQRPWRAGVVYLLPADSFETQPPLVAAPPASNSPRPPARYLSPRSLSSWWAPVTSLSSGRYEVTMMSNYKYASLQIPLVSPGSRTTLTYPDSSASGITGAMADSPEWITLAAYENVAGSPAPAAWVLA